MSNFDVLIINIYLLAIFTNLIKTKTTTYIYRFLKLLVVLMFVLVFVLFLIFSFSFSWFFSSSISSSIKNSFTISIRKSSDSKSKLIFSLIKSFISLCNSGFKHVYWIEDYREQGHLNIFDQCNVTYGNINDLKEDYFKLIEQL